MTQKQLEKAIANARHRVDKLSQKLARLHSQIATWTMSEAGENALIAASFGNATLKELTYTQYRGLIADLTAALPWDAIMELDPDAAAHDELIADAEMSSRFCEDHIEILQDRLYELDPDSPFIF
jgi:hypothetical protein